MPICVQLFEFRFFVWISIFEKTAEFVSANLKFSAKKIRQISLLFRDRVANETVFFLRFLILSARVYDGPTDHNIVVSYYRNYLEGPHLVSLSS